MSAVVGTTATGARVVSISITEAGSVLARRLPYEHVHGSLGKTVRGRWNEVDAFVLFAAVGIAARVAGPLLGNKATDPAVVCVSEDGRWVVPLAGGHSRDANTLAEEIAGSFGATAVITTASDVMGTPALDRLEGFIARGDIAGVTRALLDAVPGDRGPVTLRSELPDWPIPESLATRVEQSSPDSGVAAIIVTDRYSEAVQGVVMLHPPSLVVGVGASSGAPAEEIAALLSAALADAGLSRDSLREVATIDIKRDEPGIGALGLPIRTYPAERLRSRPVPNPSTVVFDAVGTPSVAEAAALCAAGSGAELVVGKQVSRHATVAIARRVRPRGRLCLIGLGPGDPAHRTVAATAALRRAEVVIGYGPYVEQLSDVLTPAHDVRSRSIGGEVERAREALDEAEAGKQVALVCSGDAGIYAMGSLVFEMAVEPDADIETVPGVTAAVSASALLGAPLGHDHVAISLSDLLTPWEAIERRVEAAGMADLVLALYNPRSTKRAGHLAKVRELLLGYRASGTPVGIVTEAFRPGRRIVITTLGDLDSDDVGMTTLVIVGSSTTFVRDGRMITPRGYTHVHTAATTAAAQRSVS